MTDREQFKKLAIKRLKAAKLLFKFEDYDTAGYLLGYVVELGLKAAICKRLNLDPYPTTGNQFYEIFCVHKTDRLLLLSGYYKEIDVTTNPELFRNWSTLTQDWTPDVRYQINKYGKIDIDNKFKALEDKPNGFLSWLKKGRKW